MYADTLLLLIQGILTFVLGAVMGSFLLVAATRMNVRTMGGRSKCDACGTQLRAHDMIPVVSYLVLGGRCRDCQTRISPIALLVECLMGLSFMIHSFLAGDIYTLVAGYIVLSLCCVMAVYDARSHFLPSIYLYALILVGVLYRLVAVSEVGIVHTVGGYLTMLIPASLLGLIVGVSRGRWMGAGDPLLLLGLSLVIGTWQGALMTLLLASWVGLLYALGIMIAGHLSKRSVSLVNRPIAFGPCLIVAFFIVWWFSLAGFVLFV